MKMRNFGSEKYEIAYNKLSIAFPKQVFVNKWYPTGKKTTYIYKTNNFRIHLVEAKKIGDFIYFDDYILRMDGEIYYNKTLKIIKFQDKEKVREYLNSKINF